MSENRFFYVITADIIRSRQEREAAGKANKGLEIINRRYKDYLLAECTIYRGDEIQGVLRTEVNLFRFLRHFRGFLYPNALRIGVGCGTIDSGLNRKYSWQMNGSAFYKSRKAINKIASARSPATRFAGHNDELWLTFDHFYLLLDAIQNRWSEKQWHATEAYERLGTYKAAAAELGISFQNVNKRCQAADWKVVHAVELYLNSLLKKR